MEKNMSQIISIKAMLASLFDRADTSERGLSCCKCFVDNGKFIVAMALYNSYITVFVYRTEDCMYSVLRQQRDGDWDGTAGKIADIIDCPEQNELTVSEYAEYWYSRIEPNSDIISDSIKQKRSFFFCCYPETFEDHYNPMDETGRTVLLITEFSDDFSSVHFYVHFLDTGAAISLGGDTDYEELLNKIYDSFCEYEEECQIKEREDDNRFYPQNHYDASDFSKIKSMVLEGIKKSYKNDIGIFSFRFRTDAGNFAASVVAVSSELNEVRVMIYNTDTNETFIRAVPDRQFFEKIFAADLYIALFPKEAHALYQEKTFDPMFEKIKEQITDILDKARQGCTSSCSFHCWNKDIPELGEKYSADAVLEQDSNLIHLTVKCPSKKKLSYERTVKIGELYDEILSGLYRFLYPNRIALLIEDIPTE